MKKQGTLLLIFTILAMMVNLAPRQQVALAAVPTDLFFSEYIEGTSNNKALEIYNGTGAAVDLGAGGYAIKRYSNGSPTAGATLNLTGVVAAGDVFVFASSTAGAAILAVADQTTTDGLYNGDDAMELVKGGLTLDVIGQIGVDPGTEWGTGLVSTADNTLVRKSTVCAGDPVGNDAFDPAPEWDGYVQDTFTYLGSHTASCAPDDTAPSVSSTAPVDGAKSVALDAPIDITFSEPVAVTGDWYGISCSISGAHTAVVNDADPLYTLTPEAPYVKGDVCTVTVYAAQVSDDDAIDPPDNLAADYSFTFQALLEPKINEFSASTAGTDVEFVEIFGDPGTNYSAYTLLEIEGDLNTTNSSEGFVDHVIPIGTTDAGGIYLQNLLANDLENGTITLLLVKDFTGALNNDIDANDDGVIDTPYWSAIVDAVAVNDGTVGDLTYGSPSLGFAYDGIPFVPGGASRIPDGYDTDAATDWVRNDYDLAGIPGFPGTIIVGEAYNTPGGANLAFTLPPETAPSVSSTVPANGAVDATTDTTIEINFSEVVTVADGWFNITCTSSGVHTAAVTDADPKFTLTPDVPFTALETCTVTVYAASVTDDDTNDPPDAMAADYVFSFSVVTPPEVCGDAYTPIYDIQGSGATTPLVGQELATEGIVVGDFQTNATVSGTKNGFYLQDAAGDANPETSDGVFVYSTLVDVHAGDHVRVRGTAAEYVTGTSSLTQVTSVSKIWLCSSGNAIEPTVLSLPVAATFDYEDYEGMLVKYPQPLVISEYFNFDRYGEIVLTSARHMTPTAEFEPGSPEYLQAVQNYLLDKITLDDGRTSQNPDPAIHPNGLVFDLTNLFRGGDTVQNVTGIMDFYQSLYRVQPVIGAAYTPANARTAAPDLEPGDLSVASFNVLNYFLNIDTGSSSWICGPSANLECRGADSAEELARQRAKILAALAGIDADVFGLMEIENDQDQAAADLVAGLNDVFGAGTFAYIPTGFIGTDAIKQAILYKPAAVTPVGNFALLTSAVDPRFIDTLNRPVLAQTFEDNLTGSTFTVAVNHLKSKGSACPDDPDLGDGAGNCNLTRKAAAEAMVDWLAGDPTGSGATEYLIIGDLNSYDKEDPIDAIKLGADDTAATGDDYLDMVHEFNGEYTYGYVFDGQIGYLDHALANKSLADNIIDVDFWHINADEPDLLDYNMDFKLPAQDELYAPDAYRSSDHDPVIVTMSLDHDYAAVDDVYTVDQDAVLVIDAPGVLSNDSTANPGDTLTISISTDVLHGTLLLNSDGSFTYTPDAGFFGQDSFVYDLVSTVSGQVVGQGTVIITVEPWGYLQYFPLMYKQEAGQ